MNYHPFRTSAIDRFWAKIKVDINNCWLWQGKLNDSGYGKMRINGKDMRIHRFAYELYKAKIPKGLVLDHLCRVRNCANPEHLEPVTRAENTRRGTAWKTSGDYSRNKTHCPQGHPYSGENLKVRKQGKGKYQHRQCKTCINEYKRKVYHRNKNL